MIEFDHTDSNSYRLEKKKIRLLLLIHFFLSFFMNIKTVQSKHIPKFIGMVKLFLGIILGHCIFHYHIKIPFLQEGSGFIMTRKMARQFVCFAERWINESSTYDDIELNKFFLSYNNKN